MIPQFYWVFGIFWTVRTDVPPYMKQRDRSDLARLASTLVIMYSFRWGKIFGFNLWYQHEQGDGAKILILSVLRGIFRWGNLSLGHFSMGQSVRRGVFGDGAICP